MSKESRFEIGQEVLICNSSIIWEGEVVEFKYGLYSFGPPTECRMYKVKYSDGETWVYDRQIGKDKEELIDILFSKPW